MYGISRKLNRMQEILNYLVTKNHCCICYWQKTNKGFWQVDSCIFAFWLVKKIEKVVKIFFGEYVNL